MQIFSEEFINAAKSELDILSDGEGLTAPNLCRKLGLDPAVKVVFPVLLALPEFSAYESVKSQGIRRKKVVDSGSVRE